jgi:hypothetical protein
LYPQSRAADTAPGSIAPGNVAAFILVGATVWSVVDSVADSTRPTAARLDLSLSP